MLEAPWPNLAPNLLHKRTFFKEVLDGLKVSETQLTEIVVWLSLALQLISCLYPGVNLGRCIQCILSSKYGINTNANIHVHTYLCENRLYSSSMSMFEKPPKFIVISDSQITYILF